MLLPVVGFVAASVLSYAQPATKQYNSLEDESKGQTAENSVVMLPTLEIKITSVMNPWEAQRDQDKVEIVEKRNVPNKDRVLVKEKDGRDDVRIIVPEKRSPIIAQKEKLIQEIRRLDHYLEQQRKLHKEATSSCHHPTHTTTSIAPVYTRCWTCLAGWR